MAAETEMKDRVKFETRDLKRAHLLKFCSKRGWERCGKGEYTGRYIEKVPASSLEQYQLHLGPSQQMFVSPAF